MNTSLLRISDFQNAVTRILVPKSEGGIPLPPEEGFIFHRHQFFEIMINLKGFCNYPLSERMFKLTPGTAVLIPPWVQHPDGYRSCDTELVHLWLHLLAAHDGKGLYIHNGLWTSLPAFSFSISPELCTLFQMRWEFWQQKGEPGKENLFFRNILNSFLDEMLLNERKTNDRERNIVSETITLIHNSNGRGCTLDFLAKQMKCSKYHLAHMIKNITGKSIGEIIEETRLSYVYSALEQGLTQKEIAYDLGFSSAASFWNWYHKYKK